MASSKRAIVASVAADAAIAAIKFAGGALTGSVVMVAEGIRGKEVYFWTTFVFNGASLVVVLRELRR